MRSQALAWRPLSSRGVRSLLRFFGDRRRHRRDRGTYGGLGIMVSTWVVIGLSIRAAESAPGVGPLSSKEGRQ
jgi:hypothetical protein